MSDFSVDTTVTPVILEAKTETNIATDFNNHYHKNYSIDRDGNSYQQIEDTYDEQSDVIYFQRRFDKKAVSNLFRTTVMMFTLPFVVFFATRNFVEEWGLTNEDEILFNDFWPICMSLLSVQFVIGQFAYKSWTEQQHERRAMSTLERLKIEEITHQMKQAGFNFNANEDDGDDGNDQNFDEKYENTRDCTTSFNELDEPGYVVVTSYSTVDGIAKQPQKKSGGRRRKRKRKN